MSLRSFRLCLPIRILSIALSTILMYVSSVSAFAGMEEQEEMIYEKWEQVSSLRAQGQYAEAIRLLDDIIKEYTNSEEILRRAYNFTIHTLLLMEDEQAATEKAREALERFHDLAADPIEFPPVLNRTYNELRAEMFGTLTIAKPEGGRVFLGKDFRGEIPLQLNLVRVGSYSLTVSKSGYYDYEESIMIDPSGKHVLEVSMDRQRNKRWWLYRVGPAVVAGVVLALTLGGRGEGTAAPQPLPEPPAPPTH